MGCNFSVLFCSAFKSVFFFFFWGGGGLVVCLFFFQFFSGPGKMDFKVEGPWNKEKNFHSPSLVEKKKFWILGTLEWLQQ